ncbi:recombinase family protein [Clostridium gasigenes]|uniref:recombinase family protein n=1 Tax=Clostridium gasigenes TaxID=94869 RepID=UPI001C0E6364|nr:recombinase family protein [Clostridium gasigenes]MBU3107156.1 recombinase family protein [Clostridium gasigenes]
MRVYGYARVSTKEQNLERQFEALKLYNKDIVIFKDKESGKDFDRKEYEILKRVAAPGDTIVVKEMDRLGRNKQMIKEELEYYRKLDVRVVILDIPTTTTDMSKMDEGIAKEMLKMINNILIEVLATMAEAERDKLKKRQAEGIALMPVDEDGKRLSLRPGKGAMGRPSVEYPDNWKEVYSNWKSKEITAVKAMELTGLKKNSFYNLVKKCEEK